MEQLETISEEQFSDNQFSVKMYQDLLKTGLNQLLLVDTHSVMFTIALIS
jgi:hypothetical protein